MLPSYDAMQTTNRARSIATTRAYFIIDKTGTVKFMKITDNPWPSAADCRLRRGCPRLCEPQVQPSQPPKPAPPSPCFTDKERRAMLSETAAKLLGI